MRLTDSPETRTSVKRLKEKLKAWEQQLNMYSETMNNLLKEKLEKTWTQPSLNGKMLKELREVIGARSEKPRWVNLLRDLRLLVTATIRMRLAGLSFTN